MWLDPLDPNAAAADARRAGMLRDACEWRLARLAACCQPNALLRRARRLLAWARAGQLGAGYTDPMRPRLGVQDDAYFRPCCV